MLHKLLIALCSVFAFMLTACGGGNDDTDDQSVIVDNSGNEEIVGDPVVEPEPEPWLSHTFAEAADTETWVFECANGCNATATLEHHADSEALAVTPEWASADDELEITTPIDPEIDDLSGGNAHLYLWVPTAMTQAADVNAQIVFSDASDLKGYIGYTTTEAGWNRFSLEELAAGTGTDDDYGDFGFHEEGFDLTNVNSVGVQVLGAEGLVGTDATLRIDDVILSPEPIEVEEKTEEPEPEEDNTLQARMTQNWYVDSDATTMSYVDDGVQFDATAQDQQYVHNFSGPVTLDGATIRISYTVDQDFLDSGANVQPFAQGLSGDPGHWSCWVNNGDHTAGEPHEAVCDGISDFEIADGEGFKVGVQPKGDDVAGTLTVHSMEIELDDEGADTLQADMKPNWYVDNDATTMSYVDDGVQFDATAGDQQYVHDFSGPVTLDGATIRFSYTVDQDFLDSGANVQPFAQGLSGDPGHWSCWVNNGDHTAGEPHEAVCDGISDFEIAEGEGFKVGVQPKGDDVAGTLTMHSMEIELAE